MRCAGLIEPEVGDPSASCVHPTKSRSGFNRCTVACSACEAHGAAIVRGMLPASEVHDLYCKHFEDRRKERQLLSTASFFVTFAGVRAITHAIRAERGPFKNITPGGRHIHHMTFGITGLLAVGYLWLLEIASTSAVALHGSPRSPMAAAPRSRSTSSPCG